MSEIRTQLVRRRIGTTPAQRRVLDALGLRRREAVKTFKDTPAVRGMIAKVVHLVEVKAS
ncbi:MAG: 50S ribosomal protein L30 [Deltaproteobacteria bacterium]|nr:50S ribosomal protein L30 [Deltaproteobacteria bacterium]